MGCREKSARHQHKQTHDNHITFGRAGLRLEATGGLGVSAGSQAGRQAAFSSVRQVNETERDHSVDLLSLCVSLDAI